MEKAGERSSRASARPMGAQRAIRSPAERASRASPQSTHRSTLVTHRDKEAVGNGYLHTM